MTQTPKMKSIWYFVGLVLLTMGGLVFIAGVMVYVSGTTGEKVLAHTHPGLWWGGFMVAVGALFYLKNRNAHHD